MLKPLALCLITQTFAATLKTDVVVSTKTASPPPISWHLNEPGQRAVVGASGGLKEGKPLEVLVWGGGGAVAGSLAGPFGAIVGAGVGALCGLAYSAFVVPRNGPNAPSPPRPRTSSP